MANISVPLPTKLLDAVEERVRDGHEESKSSLVRKAVEKYLDDQFVQDILLAQKEVAEGKVLRGDLKKLLKKI
ncbi:MAG: ribbon-helix-helix domain-containing protein [Patescibacteria group bacterium]